MAKENEIRQLLATAARVNRKYVTDSQLDRAAKEIVKKAHVTRDDVDLISESVTNDKEAFAVIDIDDINDILARGGNG
jgi:hypothetical protein